MNDTLSTQIQTDLDRFCAAWKTNDGAAVGGFFVDEGSIVNPFGHRAEGRAAVSAMYTEYFAGMLGGTHTRIAVRKVRPIGPDVAFTDSEQEICAPDGTVVLAVHLAALLQKVGGTWRFVDARPYTPATPPR